jgi:hypothetical protein
VWQTSTLDSNGQSLCMSAMCAGWTPTNNLSTKRHAAATRGEDNAEWTTVLSNKETTKKHPQGNGQTENRLACAHRLEKCSICSYLYKKRNRRDDSL